MTITSSTFNKAISVQTKLGYQLFVPDNYDAQQSYPIILFLHGIRKRGTDISLLDQYGLLKYAENTRGFNFFVLAPQCPDFTFWPTVRNEVLALLDQTMNEFNINKNKVYLTGFSMGGHGAWDLATHYSTIFAAIVPLAGWYEKGVASRIHVPLWVFHGEEDNMVSFSKSVEMVDELRAADKEVLFTSYPGVDHYIMDETYSNQQLYDWLLSKEKS